MHALIDSAVSHNVEEYAPCIAPPVLMRLATLLLLLLAAPALAQTPGNCALGTAERDLDVSGVLARLFNTGSLFFGNATTNGDGYLVPKLSGKSPIFAAGIWVGGTVGGDLRVAGSTYDRFEFWPGPLNEDGTLPDPDDCSPFDRFWVVDAYDLALYEATGDAAGDFADWPVHLGAPVIDGDGIEGNYDLEGGDRPAIYGHQTAFWVMNDVGNEHWKTLTDPIGLEVRVTAFTSVEAALRQHTFYRYELLNRNSEPFEDARFGLFVDPDLGDAGDDFIGSDSTRGMAFTYNGRPDDAVYGTPPPAVGYDLLTGAGASRYFASTGGGPANDPVNGEEMYNLLQGLWNDGTPLTEGGTGYMTDGDTLTWVYPGDPEAGAFWSEVNIDGEGTENSSGDRRNVIASEPFTLAPGEARAFDLALLFANGADHLNSVTVLKDASDFVQARHDAGTLFAPSTLVFPPPGTLATPEIIGPEDGTFFVQEGELSWRAVPGAEGYHVQFSTDPDFLTRIDLPTDYEAPPAVGRDGEEDPVVTITVHGIANETTTYYWRVQAVALPEQSFFSDARWFTIYRYEPEYFGLYGERIMETAYPGIEDVCEGVESDPGCAEYGWNTVYADPNSTGDYFLVSATTLDNMVERSIVEDEDFELRFSEACATPGTCLGAYVRDGALITSVPFELWNIGDEDDPSDDVRMIPLIRPSGPEPVADWADTFTLERTLAIGGEEVEVGVTERVYWMMPDRPDGYARFEEAANGFGGPGALYDRESDGDTQIDLNANGEACSQQGYYIDFCYRSLPPYRAPIGGAASAGMQVADLAGEGMTPPAGTVVRFVTNDPLFVDAEDDAPAAQPASFALEAAYPNPFRSGATVTYRLGEAGDVRLAVYDVLGRRVAVLADEPQAAGAHRARFEASGLASGVYLVVLEAGGERHARKLLLLR